MAESRFAGMGGLYGRPVLSSGVPIWAHSAAEARSHRRLTALEAETAEYERWVSELAGSPPTGRMTSRLVWTNELRELGDPPPNEFPPAIANAAGPDPAVAVVGVWQYRMDAIRNNGRQRSGLVDLNVASDAAFAEMC